MAHTQKPDFVFRRNGRVHLNRRGVSVQSTTGSPGVRISGSNAGYTMFRGSVKGSGYALISPVSHSLPLPCVTVCHHISTGVVYHCPIVGPAWKLPTFVFTLHASSWPLSCEFVWLSCSLIHNWNIYLLINCDILKNWGRKVCFCQVIQWRPLTLLYAKNHTNNALIRSCWKFYIMLILPHKYSFISEQLWL